MKRDPDILDLVEACYRFDSSEPEWLGALADAAAALFPSPLGTAAFVFRRAMGGEFSVGEIQRSPRLDPERLRGFLAGLPPEFLDAYRHGARFRASSSPAFGPPVIASLAKLGATDFVSVAGREPVGHGVWIGSPVATAPDRSAPTAELHARVAAHLVAAYRVRRKLESAKAIEDGAEAILSPAGEVEHAEGHATTRGATDALRRAAKTLDTARSSKGHRDPAGTVSAWRTLVDARWSLLDRSDTDGRRFVVATVNAPDALPAAKLSERERQVLGFAALGHHNKLIAYELGLSASTVRVLVHRAAHKLGVTRRVDAIARFVEQSSRGERPD